MAIVVSENVLSRSWTFGGQPRRELVYDAFGSEDEEAIRTALIPEIPDPYLGLSLSEVATENLGGGVWKVRATYSRFESFDEYTFDTGGGTQHVTQALATIAQYTPPGIVAPDFQGAIGVSEDRVEGVDVTSPVYQFTETHRLPDAAVTLAYKLVLFNMTGRWNDATFRGLASGECMFMGAAGSRRGDEKWSITYRFAGSPNVTGAETGDITGIDKLGWDYAWTRHADFADTSAYALVKRPVCVTVVRVSQPGDFSLLGIGT